MEGYSAIFATPFVRPMPSCNYRYPASIPVSMRNPRTILDDLKVPASLTGGVMAARQRRGAWQTRRRPRRQRYTAEKIVAAIESAGVEFIAENGSGPGVRLREGRGAIHKKNVEKYMFIWE